MNGADLTRFFTMHGENEDMRQGRPGRGHFGTGKSAAFAIADGLRLTTIQHGRRWTVELRRSDLEDASSGAPVPVRVLEQDVPVQAPNGTVVTIDLIRQKWDRREIIHTLERHLRFGFRGARVEVDGEAVEPSPPPQGREVLITATGADHPGLAGITLHLRVAKAPLAASDRGIAILADGVLHETTLAGAEHKEMAQYIFGEVDVPRLAEPYDGVPAFDMSRSGALNPANQLVLATHAFIGRNVEALRQELVTEERRRRADAEVRKLQAQADEIARLINEDYQEFRRRFQRQARSPVPGAGGQLNRPAPEGELGMFEGEAAPAEIDAAEGAPSAGEHGTGGAGPGDAGPVLRPPADDTAETTGTPAPAAPSSSRRGGGFRVEYRANGADNLRASFVSDSQTIFINMDHPQVAGARPQDEDGDLYFRRLSFEIAFTEYALAFQGMMVRDGHYLDPGEPLTELRSQLDKLVRKAAALPIT
jgi:hypothetical protein